MNFALSWGAKLLLFLMPMLLLALLVIFLLFYLKKEKRKILAEREENSRHLYELAILKELGERTGYSLNVEEILQIITGSLRQFIAYTAVGYVVVAPEKLKVNTYVEKPVSGIFLKEMKERMIASLSALTDKNFDSLAKEEAVSGAIVIDDMEQHIGSLFNIPLVIGGNVAGVLSVAHVNAGLYKEKDMTILYKITGQASEAVSRLEEVVKMEKGKLNAMVESMEDGVLMVDNDYKVVVANPSVKKIIRFNSGSDKKTDLNIFDFVDALGGKFDIHGRLEEALKKKEPFVSERINIDEAFFVIGVYPVLHTLTKGESQILGAVVVFNNVTRDVELERVREEFTSMIVHELRSPLDSIKKITELSVAGQIDRGSDQFKEYLNMIYQSSSSMLEMVNDILDLSKLQAGKFEVNKESADIKETINNRIMFYKISAESKKLSLTSFFGNNLPEKCNFDPQAVKQILNNFISNAMKFTPAGGAIRIAAFGAKPGEPLPADLADSKFAAFPALDDLKIQTSSLCVAVSDTGIGIPEGRLKDLFHTYKQVKLENADEENRGTGLGLAIAKGISEAHGGTVGVVSKENLGTSFFFTIPLD